MDDKLFLVQPNPTYLVTQSAWPAHIVTSTDNVVIILE